MHHLGRIAMVDWFIAPGGDGALAAAVVMFQDGGMTLDGALYAPKGHGPSRATDDTMAVLLRMPGRQASVSRPSR
jgi:hypothetical protein